MRRLLLALMLLAACSSDTKTPTAPTSASVASSSSTDSLLNPDVVNRIAALTSCPELQDEFDTAASNHDSNPAGSVNAQRATGYMKLADERMRALGCY